MVKETRWRRTQADEASVSLLQKELGVLPVTAQLLVNRGFVDKETASSFLSPELKDLHDPFLLSGMSEAVSRLADAVKAGEKVAIYGDYDVDGTTSTALLYLFFKSIGVEVLCYIPERLTEGYGLNKDAIKTLAGRDVKVIITVDCGINNNEEVAHAATLGIDVIITDHHEVPDELPRAVAVVDPLRKDSEFPFKGLAGVGVAFNLVIALRAGFKEAGIIDGDGPNLKRFLDIVSIGTVADVVPLVDENRVLVRYGLSELNNTTRPGLKALIDVSNARQGHITSEKIAFQLAPRINAAGRLDKADVALRLLITEDAKEARELATKLDTENSARQMIEARIRIEATEMVEAADCFPGDKAIVLYSDSWHPGVIGIVASRLVEKYGRPVALIAIDGQVGKGSLRSVNGVNLMAGLTASAATLEKFGGHKAAAGLTVSKDKVVEFRETFIGFMNSTLTDDDLTPSLDIDGELSLDELDSRFTAEIDRFSPFGRGNEKPLLCAAGAEVIDSVIVGTKHLKLRIRQNGRKRDAIAFGKASLHPLKGVFDIAFCPYMDEWNGVRSLKLSVKELRKI
jgi:single-stranded-DNA-specific exonuclease